MPDDRVGPIPISSIVSEDGAHELATSPDIQPYLKTIEELPLEKRYVWRVASALKWGFADTDDVHVEADRQTLSDEDLAKVVDLLKYRPIQFCVFLKALVGVDRMQEMMIAAIAHAKQAP